MPELPDVETFKRYIDSTALHKTIKNTTVSNTKILENISQKALTEKLNGTQLIETYRHGKYLFIKTTNEYWLVLHFGMTGFVKYFKNKEDKPSHARLLITFDNTYHLAIDNQRLLGKIILTDDKVDYIKKMNLGKDALRISQKDFIEVLSQRRGMIKSRLMDQSIIAGIGNIYADEILFQTGIHPKTKMKQLHSSDLQDMYHNMKNIFDVAIKKQVNTNQFPNSFIIPQRTKNGMCPKGKKKLKTVKVNGRTTYFCPVHQKQE
jgi:formamidopyrimidine-DNA glycosylase